MRLYMHLRGKEQAEVGRACAMPATGKISFRAKRLHVKSFHLLDTSMTVR